MRRATVSATVFTGLESPGKLLILLLVVLLVFGGKRLPEIGRSLGHGMREFKSSVGGLSLDHEDPPPAQPPAPPAAENRETP
jgi:sec-independent protein translocase protein TatA